MRLYASLVALSLAFSCCCADTDIFYKYNPDPVVLTNKPQAPARHLEQQQEASAQTFAPVPSAIGGASAPSTHLKPIANGANDPVDVRISDVIAASVLRFAQRIAKQLQPESNSNKNEVFSPLSVMSALALLMLGAKGQSYKELIDLFGNDLELLSQPHKLHEQFGLMLKDLQQEFASSISPKRGQDPWRYSEAMQNIRSTRRSSTFKPTDHIIHVANGLFAQTGYSLNPDYKTVINKIYYSELAELDFSRSPAQSRVHINNWVDQHTYGKIPSIIDDEIQAGTYMILVSALYFKAFWEYDFFVSATRVDQFYPDGEGSAPINVNMMATGGTFPYYDSPEHGCRIIGLPYKGNMSTMYIIQPHQSTRAKLHNLQQTLDAVDIENMILRMVRRSALVAFPKMHLQRSINMKKLLISMGIRDIFKNGVSDLSLIGAERAVNPMGGGSIGTKLGNEVPPNAAAPAASAAAPAASEAKPAAVDQTLSITNDRTQQKQSRTLDRFGGPALLFTRSSFTDLSASDSLKQLEALRKVASLTASDLFVDDIVHKVDFDVNEHGTEAAAATVVYLKKSGPEVTFRADSPFMLLVRHDPTKLILFYGIINAPPIASSSGAEAI